YMPKLEASFMRDFGCCGQTLPTLHDLLEHYKAEHAQQTPQSIRPINSTVGSTMEGEKERKPFRCPVIGQTLPTLHDLSEHYEAGHAQQTPQSIRPINSTVGSTMEEEKERKPFRCPVIGCENTYKNQNGLKYHKTHGHQNHLLHENGDGTFSIINPETSKPYPGTLGMEKEKPYQCVVCEKRYKNLYGLKYVRSSAT
ncbi:hypothetical protein BGZ57DRAFT_712170, partial [Hyaloscypha finlandica]